MRLAIAQLNPVVGDLAGNSRRFIEAAELARRDGADVVVGSELGLVGYPPRDLLLRGGFVDACERAVAEIARHATGLTVIVGHPRHLRKGGRLRNSVSVCSGGRVVAVYDKRLLPGYDVFDEDRYFEPGEAPCVVQVAGRRVGLLICDDHWQALDVPGGPRYRIDPVAETAPGCDLILSVHATHSLPGKWARHIEQLRQMAATHGRPIVAVNQVGANDDLIYDGRSVVVEAGGSVAALLPGWREAVQVIDLPGGGPVSVPVVDPMAELFHCLVLGVDDYCRKSGIGSVVIGLSGGIDSSVVACIAAAARGRERVLGVIMPSRYSSADSAADATALAANLGLSPCPVVPIETIHAAAHEALAIPLGAASGGVTDENVQARIRGMLLMAFANGRGALLMGTGNKSELASGYCTLYGDMAGAIAVIGDVLKTRVYALARWINANHLAVGFDRPPIPARCLTRAPSAELRPDQTDQDTLPPYEDLDAIIERHVEREQPFEQIVEETGLGAAFVARIVAMIDRAQHKREQAPLVLKVSPRSFGRGRPMPIVMDSGVSHQPSAIRAVKARRGHGPGKVG